MRPLVRLGRAAQRHPLLLDLVLAASVAGVSLSVVLQQPADTWNAFDQQPADTWNAFDGPAFALTLLVNMTLTVRRRAPRTVMTAYCLLWAGYITAGYRPLVNSAGALLALYTVALYHPPRQAVIAAGAAAAVWVYAGVRADDGWPIAVLVQGVAWSGLVAYFGNRARQVAILAARLRQGQEERARRAVVGERVRIARELHDVVAHHMSVISVQAGLARYVLHSDLAVVRTALDTVLQASTEALDEMRRMLELLRVDQHDATSGRDTRTQGYDPAPGLDRLPDLLNRVRAGGVPVELTVTGDRRPLPSGLDLCVFRVVQEGLTNVIKHAAPASATVTMHYGRDHVVACITDDGCRRQPAASGAAPGHGLIGMGERARLYGGTLTAGHRPEGGFEVCLTLPLPPGEESERSPAG